MSTNLALSREIRPPDENGPTRDDIFEILANRRRRFVIHYLQLRERAVELGTLAEQLAAWENLTSVESVTAEERKRTYTSLQQRHLPRMDDAGLLDFDRRDGLVEPAGVLADLDVYAEVVRGGEFPWSHYYAGLSAVTGAVMVAVWAGMFPFVLLPTEAWSIFCVTAFAVSAAVHVYATRQMRLGGSAIPPELEEAEVA